MYTGVHLVVSRENLSFELFDLPFDHVHWCTLDVKENRDTWLSYCPAITKLLHSKVLKQTLVITKQIIIYYVCQQFYLTRLTQSFSGVIGGKEASYITVVVGYLCY